MDSIVNFESGVLSSSLGRNLENHVRNKPVLKTKMKNCRKRQYDIMVMFLQGQIGAKKHDRNICEHIGN